MSEVTTIGGDFVGAQASAWDPVNDIVLFGLAALLVALAFWVNADLLGML